MFSHDFAGDPATARKLEAEIRINALAPLRLTHEALPLLERSRVAPAFIFVQRRPAASIRSGIRGRAWGRG
ncbi:MAG: hypothetical protein ACMVO5_10155 [Polymorphobacter sp.]|uniref:hypothetical protein n=1 Tax=Polymorphobacter sp. TaxID=1909290 RepID=UPI003A84F042